MAKKWASPTDTGTYSSWLAMRGRCDACKSARAAWYSKYKEKKHGG